MAAMKERLAEVMDALAMLATEDGHPERPTRYEPWTNGHAVGFKVTRDDRVEYIYLNPSTTEGEEYYHPNVFVYQGTEGGEGDDPLCYFDVLVDTK